MFIYDQSAKNYALENLALLVPSDRCLNIAKHSFTNLVLNRQHDSVVVCSFHCYSNWSDIHTTSANLENKSQLTWQNCNKKFSDVSA